MQDAPREGTRLQQKRRFGWDCAEGTYSARVVGLRFRRYSGNEDGPRQGMSGQGAAWRQYDGNRDGRPAIRKASRVDIMR